MGVCISILSGGGWERDGERAIPDGFLIVGSYSLNFIFPFSNAFFLSGYSLMNSLPLFPFPHYWAIGLSSILSSLVCIIW